MLTVSPRVTELRQHGSTSQSVLHVKFISGLHLLCKLSMINVSPRCQCQFIKCKVCFVLGVMSLKFPLARLQNESVGIRLVLQHIYESEEVQTDESFFPVCLTNVCMIKLSLMTKDLLSSLCIKTLFTMCLISYLKTTFVFFFSFFFSTNTDADMHFEKNQNQNYYQVIVTLQGICLGLMMQKKK